MERMHRPQPWHPLGHILLLLVVQFTIRNATTQIAISIQGKPSPPFRKVHFLLFC